MHTKNAVNAVNARVKSVTQALVPSMNVEENTSISVNIKTPPLTIAIVILRNFLPRIISKNPNGIMTAPHALLDPSKNTE